MVVRDAPARRRVGCSLAVLALTVALKELALMPVPASAATGLPFDNPIGVHSMLYLDHPFTAKDAMFKEAAAVGASTIRLDVSLANVFRDRNGPPDWSGVDQYMLLARRYRLRVLADLLATPWYLAACPPATPNVDSYRCAPTSAAAWGRDAGLIAAHTRGVIDYFEIINEPDGSWAFDGTAQQYAQILSACYRAIHAANPAAEVVLGGLMHVQSHAWLDAVLATPGADGVHSFDVANLHIRGRAAQAGAVVTEWRHHLASRGFTGPLWVTETGYPADPTQQTDDGYKGGPSAQAKYLRTVIPAMICAGAAKVFLTERDGLAGRYATEGFLQTADPLTANPSYARRPSFYAIRTIAGAIAGSTSLPDACRAARDVSSRLSKGAGR